MSPKNDRARLTEVGGAGESTRTPEPMPRARDVGVYQDAEPTLAQYLWTVVENRGLVAVCTVMAVVLAAGYLFFAPPTFRSDVLIQVEDKTKSVAGLDDLSSMFSDKTPADTEIEIIRSRLLLGSVVDQLDLTVAARPRMFPLIGGALYRRHEGDEVGSPVLGMTSFAWGGERIRVQRLQVPDGLLDEELRLIAKDGRQFQLLGPDGQTLLSGEVGKVAGVREGDDRIEVFITDLRARPGTEFRLVKRRRANVIDELQTEMRVAEKGKKTGILSVVLDGKDARRTAAILDAVAQTYQRQNVERKSAEASTTLEFLQQQLPLLKKNLDTAEAAFNRYQLKKGSVDLTLETQAMLDRLVAIETSLSDMELQRVDLRHRFTDNHPSLISMKQKEDKLRAERAALNEKMRGLPEQELESARFTRDVKVASELYFLLINKSQELQVVKSGTIGNVRIIDSALLPYEPVSPKRVPLLALALLLGLAGGIGGAFVKKSMDHGVDNPDEIEAGTGLPVYAAVPHSDLEAEQAGRHHHNENFQLLAAVDPSDLAVESLRSLRTGLQFALVEARNNVITIGGPSPGVGKSFVSVNLAYVLASTGKRILLIDADLRRGHLHRYLGGTRGPGVSEIVSGQVAISEATRKTVQENLDFIATGALPPNPAELVGSQHFQAFLSDASAKYELVLVDTPPILAVTDGALIGRHAGVNLMVLRAGEHPLREIALALKRLGQGGVTVNGAVLNDVPVGQGRYAKYGYHYNYQYEYQSDSK